MSEPRQPVKGKPHIVPAINGRKDARYMCGFWVTGASGAENFVMWATLDEWGSTVVRSWDRWWRQHQEAA